MAKLEQTEHNPGLSNWFNIVIEGFVGFGLLMAATLFVSGSSQDSSWLFTLLALPGFILIAAGVATFLIHWRYRRFKIWIEEDIVKRGDEFHVRFEQAFRWRTKVRRANVFLIYREIVSMHPVQRGESVYVEVQIFDRLLDGCEQDGGTFGPGKVLSGRHRLRLPGRTMSARHPFRYKRPNSTFQYRAIKVRIELMNGHVEWKEFQFVTDFDPQQVAPSPQDELTSEMFDLFCCSVPEKVRARERWVWKDAVPHGLWGYKADSPRAPSFFVLERRSRAELEGVKARLEETGAVLEIRPSV